MFGDKPSNGLSIVLPKGSQLWFIGKYKLFESSHVWLTMLLPNIKFNPKWASCLEGNYSSTPSKTTSLYFRLKKTNLFFLGSVPIPGWQHCRSRRTLNIPLITNSTKGYWDIISTTSKKGYQVLLYTSKMYLVFEHRSWNVDVINEVVSFLLF